MELDKNEDIKALLKKHGYEIYVFCEESNVKKVSLIFPNRKEKPVCDSFAIEYEAYEGSKDSFPGLYTLVEGYEKNFTTCPKYAIKELVFSNIEILCRYMLYDGSLVRFYLGEKEVQEEKFWEKAMLIKLNKEEKGKQKRISEIMSEVRSKGFGKIQEQLSSEFDISDGYSAIKSTYTEKEEK